MPRTPQGQARWFFRNLPRRLAAVQARGDAEHLTRFYAACARWARIRLNHPTNYAPPKTPLQ